MTLRVKQQLTIMLVFKYIISKTRSFKEFTTCNTIEFDFGKNQLLCQTFDTNKYGDGSRIDEIYDFDGKLLSNNEVEIVDFEEVPLELLPLESKRHWSKKELNNNKVLVTIIDQRELFIIVNYVVKNIQMYRIF